MEEHSVEEVSVRKLKVSDAEHAMTWLGDDEVTQPVGMDALTSVEEVKKFLETWAETHPWCKAICLNGVPVGFLTLQQGSGVDCCRAMLAYVLRKDHWGKGITTQAVTLALLEGFRELEIERVEALVLSDNKASQKVLLKAGFVQEGLLRKYKFIKGIARDCLIFGYIKPA